jgi:rhodanese-related sulfurtransferase
MSITVISPKELASRRDRGEPIDLIDVRTPAEYRELHAAQARNVPLESLDAAAVLKARNGSSGALYVICRTGNRGQKACEKLAAAGAQVVNVEGGTLAWEAAGLPVVRGKKTMSLERQVRIAAGSLVVLGAALGYFLHPAFIGLAAFVGAGLVFAGVTDTCGMGMVLAKMPWNQVKDSCGVAR